MNSARSLEALLYREHESRISSLRGKELPKHERGDTDADVRVAVETERQLLAQRIIQTFTRGPELSAQEIAKRCETSHATVLRVLRKAGLKR